MEETLIVRPLRLKSSLGRIEFVPIGYEFPKIREGDDANWLSVQFTYHLGSRLITAVSPCLLADEIEVLRTWIRGRQVSPLRLLEAGLSFHFVGENTLVIELSWGAVPIEMWSKDCLITTTIDDKYQTLELIDHVLEEWARAFPVR